MKKLFNIYRATSVDIFDLSIKRELKIFDRKYSPVFARALFTGNRTVDNRNVIREKNHNLLFVAAILSSSSTKL